jgi:hypothetical protein
MFLKARSMKTTFALFFLSLVLAGCNFSKSAKKDLMSGLSSTGNNISCDEVYLTVNDERTTRNSFIYGETFFLNFSDVKGFAKENGNVFPGMKLVVINPAGDTMMQTADLMSKYPEGMNFSPLLLTADLTLAAPIKSKSEYTAFVNIWDRKGDGTYKSKFDFKVLENDKINIESSRTTYDEIYLFSQGNDKVITDNKIKFNDNIYIILEGLKGFSETGGMVFPGLSIKASDSASNVLLESDDLFTDYSASGIAAADIAERVSAHFSIPGPQFNNPLHCELTVWDKKSDAKIKVNTEMVLE